MRIQRLEYHGSRTDSATVRMQGGDEAVDGWWDFPADDHIPQVQQLTTHDVHTGSTHNQGSSSSQSACTAAIALSGVQIVSEADITEKALAAPLNASTEKKKRKNKDEKLMKAGMVGGGRCVPKSNCTAF